MIFNILEISRSAVAQNLKLLRSTNKEVCCMVKGYSYGIGDDGIQLLIDQGVSFFGVSNFNEAVSLRKLNHDCNILITTYVDATDLHRAVELNLIVTIFDFEGLSEVIPNLRYHLKIDTGMNRLGFCHSTIDQLLITLKNNNFSPEGIYSHLYNAADETASLQQISQFELILKQLSEFEFHYIHIHNSLGTIKYQTTFDNLVRPGLGL